jgi:hypothetical protein
VRKFLGQIHWTEEKEKKNKEKEDLRNSGNLVIYYLKFSLSIILSLDTLFELILQLMTIWSQASSDSSYSVVPFVLIFQMTISWN